jgi:hypothetical protein
MIEHLEQELAESMKQDNCTKFIKEMLERVKGGEKLHEFLLAAGKKYDADVWTNYPFVMVYRDEPDYFKLEPKRAYRACKNVTEAAKFIGKQLVNKYEVSIVYTVIAVSEDSFYCNSKMGKMQQYTFDDLFRGAYVQDTNEKVGVLE